MAYKCGESPMFQEMMKGANRQMKDVPAESELWGSEFPQALRVNAISVMVGAVVNVFGLRCEAIMSGEFHP